MSRVMVDGSGLLEWLVVAAGVEREVADELAVLVDHPDLPMQPEDILRVACSI